MPEDADNPAEESSTSSDTVVLKFVDGVAANAFLRYLEMVKDGTITNACMAVLVDRIEKVE